MAIVIKNIFREDKRAENVVNQGGGSGHSPPEKVNEVRETKQERNDLPFVFTEKEEDEIINFLLNKMKCVEVTNEVAWISRGSLQRSSFYSKKT
jgi:hypothetical protein